MSKEKNDILFHIYEEIIEDDEVIGKIRLHTLYFKKRIDKDEILMTYAVPNKKAGDTFCRKTGNVMATERMKKLASSKGVFLNIGVNNLESFLPVKIIPSLNYHCNKARRMFGIEEGKVDVLFKSDKRTDDKRGNMFTFHEDNDDINFFVKEKSYLCAVKLELKDEPKTIEE